MRVLSPFSDLVTFPSIIFASPFKGKPELILAIGSLLHFVNNLLSDDFPLNTLISIWSSYTRLNFEGSPV